MCFDDALAARKAAQDGMVVIKGEKGEDTVVELSLREGFVYQYVVRPFRTPADLSDFANS